MSGTRIELVGGPLCGKVLHPSRPALYLFIDGDRCWRTPSQTRHLYARTTKRTTTEARAVPYVYEGHRRVYCASCGAFNAVNGKPLVDCALCGEKLSLSP